MSKKDAKINCPTFQKQEPVIKDIIAKKEEAVINERFPFFIRCKLAASSIKSIALSGKNRSEI